MLEKNKKKEKAKDKTKYSRKRNIKERKRNNGGQPHKLDVGRLKYTIDFFKICDIIINVKRVRHWTDLSPAPLGYKTENSVCRNRTYSE